jgi:hypothetical protein
MECRKVQGYAEISVKTLCRVEGNVYVTMYLENKDLNEKPTARQAVQKKNLGWDFSRLFIQTELDTSNQIHGAGYARE